MEYVNTHKQPTFNIFRKFTGKNLQQSLILVKCQVFRYLQNTYEQLRLNILFQLADILHLYSQLRLAYFAVVFMRTKRKLCSFYLVYIVAKI